MPDDIQDFIKSLLSNQNIDLSLYKSTVFCEKIELFALEKIKSILLNILASHLPHERVGSTDPFFLSEEINKPDHDGLTLLDYCSIAGLHDMGRIFAKLGCKNNIDTNAINKNINAFYTEDLNKPKLVRNINSAFESIEQGKQEYKDNPLANKSPIDGVANPTIWQKFKHIVKNFPYNQHKFAILVLLFGLSCIIAAPFTSGLSTILLLSLGFPSMLSGISNLQSAVATLTNYQQVEENSRITHEAKMVRLMHKEVTHEIEVRTSAHKQIVSMHVTQNHQMTTVQSTNLLYTNSHNASKMKKNKKTKVKLEPFSDY